MDDIKLITIEERALELAKSPQIEDVVKAAALLKSIAETEKALVDSRKADAEKKNAQRFWISALSPYLSLLILSATVVFQVMTFKETSKLQRETTARTFDAQNVANEQTQWREFLKLLNEPGFAHNPSIPSVLKSFDSSKYHSHIRLATILFLRNVGDVSLFQLLFPSIKKNTNWSNFIELCVLNHGLVANYRSALESQELNKPYKDSMFNKPSFYAHQFDKEIFLASTAIQEFLKDSSSTRPKSVQLDLSDVSFTRIDLSNINFNNADITETEFAYCDVTNASFTDVVGYNEFAGCDWKGTAWWRAKELDTGLVRYLSEKFPRNANENYYSVDRIDYSEEDKKLYSYWISKIQ